MRKCSQCGSLNDNELQYCKECHNKLDKILSIEEEKNALLEEQKINNQEDEEDIYIHGVEVTKADKISALVSLAGIIISVVLLFVLPNTPDKKPYVLSILPFSVSILFSVGLNVLIFKYIYYENSNYVPLDSFLFIRKIIIYILNITGFCCIIFKNYM